MKANHRLRLSFAAAAVATAMALGSCAQQRVAPVPATTAKPGPAPAPSPVPREPADWREAPITPGDWAWGMEGGNSVARFAGGALVLGCDPASRTVTLSRAGSATGPVPMTITTDSISRTLTATAQPGRTPAIAATFDARDPLLDAMVFSRGRFAVETAGLPTLYVPSWPEPGRVIEDCR